MFSLLVSTPKYKLMRTLLGTNYLANALGAYAVMMPIDKAISSYMMVIVEHTGCFPETNFRNSFLVALLFSPIRHQLHLRCPLIEQQQFRFVRL